LGDDENKQIKVTIMRVMEEFATADVVIGVIASMGVVILLVVFVYVVRRVLTRQD
jgi:flagellar biogenesis protein FliO